MIPFKMKKPNSVSKNTAVILVIFQLFEVSSGYLQLTRMTDRERLTTITSQPLKENRRRIGDDEVRNDRIDIINPYIEDVRADSRQSRIDATDIRTDFKEIRTELGYRCSTTGCNKIDSRVPDTFRDFRELLDSERSFRDSRSDGRNTREPDNARSQSNDLRNIRSQERRSANLDRSRRNQDVESVQRSRREITREQNSFEQNASREVKRQTQMKSEESRSYKTNLADERNNDVSRSRNIVTRRISQEREVDDIRSREDSSITPTEQFRRSSIQARNRRISQDREANEKRSRKDTRVSLTERSRRSRADLVDESNNAASRSDFLTRNTVTRKISRDRQADAVRSREDDRESRSVNSVNRLKLSRDFSDNDNIETRINRARTENRQTIEPNSAAPNSFRERESKTRDVSREKQTDFEQYISTNDVSRRRSEMDSRRIRRDLDSSRNIRDIQNDDGEERQSDFEQHRSTDERSRIRDSRENSRMVRRDRDSSQTNRNMRVNDSKDEELRRTRYMDYFVEQVVDMDNKRRILPKRRITRVYNDLSTLIRDKYSRDENNNEIVHQLNPDKPRTNQERLFERHMANLEKLESKRFEKAMHAPSVSIEKSTSLLSNGFVNALQIILVCALVGQIWKTTQKTKKFGFDQWLNFAKLKVE